MSNFNYTETIDKRLLYERISEHSSENTIRTKPILHWWEFYGLENDIKNYIAWANQDIWFSEYCFGYIRYPSWDFKTKNTNSLSQSEMLDVLFFVVMTHKKDAMMFQLSWGHKKILKKDYENGTTLRTLTSHNFVKTVL